MRVYLDTNILAFMVGQDQRCSISNDVDELIDSYDTLLLSSSVCFAELVHLIQIGKVCIPGQKDVRKASVLALKRLEEMGVSMVPTTMEHIKTLMELPLYDDHRDPNDRLIIAQAMSDRVTLISSDRKFMRYGRYGLDFIFNER